MKYAARAPGSGAQKRKRSWNTHQGEYAVSIRRCHTRPFFLEGARQEESLRPLRR